MERGGGGEGHTLPISLCTKYGLVETKGMDNEGPDAMWTSRVKGRGPEGRGWQEVWANLHCSLSTEKCT